MTNQEALKRSEKSQNLKVWQADDTWFYVESEDGKIAYKCCITDQGDYCNCGDFATRSKNDHSFKCKHLLAVMNSVPRNEVLEAQFLDKRRPKLDESFIKQIDDKDFVIYAGLLDVAHQKNLCMVDVELIQFPSEENKQTAICKAKVETTDGRKFSDIGDANPQNCNSKVARHLIRMASTRAKARAFRDMDNIGMTALEELGDLSEVIGNNNTVQPKKNNVKPFIKPDANKPLAMVKENMAPVAKVKTDEITKPLPNEKTVPVNATVDAAADSANAANAPVPADPVPVKDKKTKAAKPGNGNGNGAAKTEKTPMMSEAQKSALFNLSRRRGISLEDIETRAREKYGVPAEQLTAENAGEFIRYLQAAS
jgi:hypothetical protein